MRLEKIKNFSLKDVVLISSLPDMGKVGGLVSQFLSKTLGTKVAAKIILSDKPWVNQKEGLIFLPTDEYQFVVDEKNSIVIFTGDNQPQEAKTVIEMTDLVFSTVSEMGNLKMIISTGGYFPIEPKNGNGVYGVATNEKSLKLLNSFNVFPLSSEVSSITWFNGLILGKAKENNVDGVGLFGEIEETDLPQYSAAVNILKILEKILKIKLETKELEEKIIPPSQESKEQRPGIG